jgi:hypothetical protein
MKKIGLFLLVAIMILLYGCPYSSEVPIDEPSVKYDQNIIGKWAKPSNENDYYLIKSFDDYRFIITSFEKNSDGGYDSKDYYCYFSKIKDVLFLNMKEADKNEYTFYKVVFDGNSNIKLYPVTEYITEKFTKSSDLKKFFSKNLKLSFFYETPDEYEKM